MSTRLDLAGAAALLDLPVPAVAALASSGYLAAVAGGPNGLEFQVSDVKAFLARNADNGTGHRLLDRALAATAPPLRTPGGPLELEPAELLDLLEERADYMAGRVFKIYSAVFPEADKWPEGKQGAFVAAAKGRFEAILAVTELGAGVDEAIYDELRGVGTSAARSGTPLPQLLVLLRMSRDLVVQNAVELAEGGDRHGGHALSLLLTRILPAMDGLGDALAQGYWEGASDQD